MCCISTDKTDDLVMKVGTSYWLKW